MSDRKIIYADDAINALAKMMPKSYTPDGSHPADEEIFRAQEIFADCIKTIKILPPAQPEQRWIACSERLPEDNKTVLITHRGGVSFGWYNGRYWERGAGTNHRPLQTVIAWMPLPEPYKGGQECTK